jgi:hypothetical protein
MQMMPTMSCAQRVVEEVAVSDLTAAVEEAVINPTLGEIFLQSVFSLDQTSKALSHGCHGIFGFRWRIAATHG